MNPLTQQVFTLLAVLLGAGATYSVTALTERSRRRRAQQTRWDDNRLNAYVEYANAVKKCVQMSYRIAGFRGLPSRGQPLGPVDGLPLLADAEAARAQRWEAVLLLGEIHTIDAARRCTKPVGGWSGLLVVS